MKNSTLGLAAGSNSDISSCESLNVHGYVNESIGSNKGCHYFYMVLWYSAYASRLVWGLYQTVCRGVRGKKSQG